MGCSSSKAEGGEGAVSTAPEEEAAAAEPPRTLRSGFAAPSGSGRFARPPPREQTEKLSSKTLERLRSTFLLTATRGSVYDYYSLGRTLGTGGYAVVKLGVHLESGQEVAVKIMRLPCASAATRRSVNDHRPSSSHVSGLGSQSAESAEEDVFKEIEILKSLSHPSVLKMREYFIGGSRDKVYIITELMRGGELLEALLERGSYSETDARTIFKQILSGVAYLHSKHITHRDLKLENLLLADKGDLSSVRIADFGLAKAAFGGDPNGDPNASPFAMDVMCGTLAYVAPEVLGRRRYTPAVDLWSCGVILYILLSGVVPFDDPDERRLTTKIMRGAYSLTGSEWACISVEAKALVSGLMCLDVSQRLSAAQALGHAWFQRGAEADAMRNASVRLVAFAARSKPPVRTFLPGSFLVTTGDRATEVFLIRTGACEVLVEEPSGSTGQLGEEEEGARFQVLGTRGVGEFVGEQGVITNERGELTLGGATVGASAAEDAGRQASPRTQADALWSSPLVAHKFARKWVGKRRTCSVRALTEVTALVLQRREMAWALENDSMQLEVLTALDHSRRRTLHR